MHYWVKKKNGPVGRVDSGIRKIQFGYRIHSFFQSVLAFFILEGFTRTQSDPQLTIIFQAYIYISKSCKNKSSYLCHNLSKHLAQ